MYSWPSYRVVAGQSEYSFTTNPNPHHTRMHRDEQRGLELDCCNALSLWTKPVIKCLLYTWLSANLWYMITEQEITSWVRGLASLI